MRNSEFSILNFELAAAALIQHSPFNIHHSRQR